MTQNNSAILQLFARKFSFCRHKIPAEKLAQYLKNGEFGFSFDHADRQLITNDTVFAAETEQLTDHIRAIFTEPHIPLKKDRIVRNVSAASQMDTQSVNATYKDEKLWSVRRDKGISPEFVHTYVYEDDFAIYENRFVCFLLDLILETVSKKLKVLCGEPQTFNRKIDRDTQTAAYSSDVSVNTDEAERNPVLSSSKDPNVSVIRSLLKSKRVLEALKNHELYIACKKAGAFPIQTLSQTNILAMDRDYRFCYLFYTHYLNEKRYITSESNEYTNFILVHIFSALLDEGYTVSEDSEDVLIDEDAEIKLRKLIFEKGLFRIRIFKNSIEELLFDVTETADGCNAKYLFRILSSEKPLELGERSLEDYAKELDQKRAADITRVFLICDKDAASDLIVSVVPGEAAVSRNLAEAIKSVTILAEGASFPHKEYCPVCGSPFLATEKADYACSACDSLYHLFRYESRELIWIKRPFDVAVEAEAVPVMADTSGRKMISKSFEGKLSQASKDQKAFYAELKNYMLAFKRTNSRVSWSYDSFRVGRNAVFRIGFRGRTMVAYFALNPADYVDTKYFTYDMSDKKKFEITPLMIKVKSRRGVKHAKELIDVICNGLDKKKDFVAQTYKIPYMSDKELRKKGLLKESFVQI